jgi:Ca2+-binding EF-hand superfamily protein
MKKNLLIFALSLLVLPAFALAGEEGKEGKALKKGGAARIKEAIAQYDKDGDGKLTAHELGLSESFFALLDRDGDGFVTGRELAPARPRRKGPEGARGGNAVARLDADKDGRISRDEWKMRPEMFEKLDRDADGFLSNEELEPLRARFGRRRGQQGAPGRAGGPGAERLLKGVQRMDADGDGTVTREEWKGRPEMFGQLDQDGDGAISNRELKAFQKEIKQRQKQMGFGGRRGRGGGAAQDLFRVMDGNRDGAITRDEWRLNADLFGKMDSNGDGAIRMDEIAPEEGAGDWGPRPAGPAPDKATFFERYDKNSDGKVTRQEFTGPPSEFERYDRNHDGVVDKADGLRGA